jgi:hypothetical protein
MLTLSSLRILLLYITIKYELHKGAVLVQSVRCITTDWTSGVRSPVEAKDISSSLCVQTSSEAHPGSYPMGTEGHFPGVKHCRGVPLTTPLLPSSRMNRSYTSSPWRLHGVAG